MTIPLPSSTRLAASTGNDYNYSQSASKDHDFDSTSGGDTDSSTVPKASSRNHDSGNFRTLSWSADGTSLVTTSADNILRTFILPPNLLESPTPDSGAIKQAEYHHLSPYSNHPHPSSLYATALSPYYNISSPETTLILVSPSSLPIRLISPFAPGVLATYPLVNPSTEKWITPHSLLFSTPYGSQEPEISDEYAAGNVLRFLAGSQNQISIFDISRYGEGPMTELATAPGNRKVRRGGSNGMSGIVSTMAMSCDGTLAAGTFSRGVGLYDSHGAGDTMGTWSLNGSEEGSGVSSLHWSRCGRYLVVAERGSDGLGVWDIRGLGKRLAWLTGRHAGTMQRLGVALGSNLEYQSGDDVYAGGIDGCVRVWYKIGMNEGLLESDWYWKAHEDVVSGLGIHACGTVLVTCSGSRQDVGEEESTVEVAGNPSSGSITKTRDNSIRVWSVEQPTIDNA